MPFPLYQLLVAGEAAAMLGLTFLHLKLHPWAVYYFKVVIVLHLLWGLAGHLWLATQHMAAQAYQEDDLDRAIRFKEMVVMQVRDVPHDELSPRTIRRHRGWVQEMAHTHIQAHACTY